MSSALDAAVDSAIVPVRRFVPRRLTALDRRGRRRPRLIYGIVAVAGTIAIGALQMGLSIVTTQTSYQLSALNTQQRELTWQKQILNDELAGLGSPQYLAANATALGMVIDESPSYLRLSDGAVLGAQTVAAGGSSVDALGRASVPNELVAETPLITDSEASLAVPSPPPVPKIKDPTTKGAAENKQPAEPIPAPLTDGLPTPSTH